MGEREGKRSTGKKADKEHREPLLIGNMGQLECQREPIRTPHH